MSFRRDYLPYFSLRIVNHANDEAIPGVAIAPAAQCRQKLHNLHLLTRRRAHGLDVYYTRNPWSSAPVLGEISSRVQLDLPGSGQLHLFTLTAAGAVKPGDTVSLAAGTTVAAGDAIRIVPEKFTIPITLNPGATDYEVRGQFDNTVLLEIPVSEIGSGQGGQQVEFDLRDVGERRVRLSPDNQPTEVTSLLVNNSHSSGRAQGIVSIFLEQSQQLAPAEGYQFEARFEHR